MKNRVFAVTRLPTSLCFGADTGPTNSLQGLKFAKICAVSALNSVRSGIAVRLASRCVAASIALRASVSKMCQAAIDKSPTCVLQSSSKSCACVLQSSAVQQAKARCVCSTR
eukprot:5513-Heterococcus_DN1.PRE.2